ncbi:MAG: hypothetical protein WBV94_16400 [Blastocatellia bacterium]
MTVTANVKPLPAFLARISNADIAHGERVGAFNVWPIARPIVTIERGERVALTLRIRPVESTGGNLKLANASEIFKLRREANGEGYLLDMAIEPSNDLTQRVLPAVLQINDGTSGELALQLTVNVQAENLVPSPRQLDLGEVSLANLRGGATASGRMGIRKIVGTFHIKSLTSTLDFLKLEQRVIIEGSNYVIRVRLDETKLPKAATYTGVLRIETDDPLTPRVEVPVKVIVKE